MKICIAGGTGNVRQPIVKLLLEKGHEVVLFNRRQSAKAPEGVRVIVGASGIAHESTWSQRGQGAGCDGRYAGNEQAVAAAVLPISTRIFR